MQSLPIDIDKDGEGLVHWTFPEVSGQFQGTRISIHSSIPYMAQTKEECYIPIDHASREGGKLEGLHASL